MATCRSCGKGLRWVTTVRGKKMPLDQHPNPEGNVWLDVLGVANVLPPGASPPDPMAPRYTSHFATCKSAGEHRAPARAEKKPPATSTPVTSTGSPEFCADCGASLGVVFMRYPVTGAALCRICEFYPREPD